MFGAATGIASASAAIAPGLLPDRVQDHDTQGDVSWVMLFDP
jgi:hypothetical protein